MRRIIATALCVLMIVSLAVVGISAEEATVIKTPEEFAAIKIDGNYKLGNNITVSDTLVFKDAENNEIAFTGTIDGCGYTITVSKPVFNKFAGTVKNLVIEGSVSNTASDGHVAPLALRGSGNVVLENVVNKATVDTAYRGGGIISQIDEKTTASIIGCVNYGNVTHTGETSCMIGGILGYEQGNTLVLKDCVNYGTVSAEKGLAGGIIGRFGGDNAFNEDHNATITNCLNEGAVSGSSNVGGIMGLARGSLVTIANCTNKGAITSTTNDAAGIIGHGGAKNYLARVFVSKCLNEGKIECKGGTVDSSSGLPTEGTNSAAGIAGYVYGSGDNGRIEITDCVNKGEIVAKAFASQFMGYTNQPQTVIKNCVGDGKISGAVKVIVGVSSANPLDYTLEGIKLTANDSTDRLSFATAASNSGNCKLIADYTALEGKTDAIVSGASYTPDASIGYQAPAASSDPGTVTPVTGDSVVWIAALAVVSVLGMALSLKTRKN